MIPDQSSSFDIARPLSTAASADATPNGRMYVAISTAMAGAVMFGLDQGNYGNVQNFEDFRRHWCVGAGFGTEETCGGDPDRGAGRNAYWQTSFVQWGASLITLGAACGGLLLGPLVADRHGRRPCVSVGAGVCCLGCVVASLLSFRRVAVFMLGRFLTGFGVGVSSFALPVYSSEIATPGVRGLMGGLFPLLIVIGSFAASLATTLCREWRLGMLLPGIAGLAVAPAVWLTPESPRFVMEKRGYAAGAAALARVRRGDVGPEAAEICAQLEAERGAGRAVTYRELLRGGSLRRRVLVACYLQVAQQLTGVNAFVSYSSTVFADAGFTDPLKVSVLWSGVAVLGTLAGLAVVDSPRGGRRAQLLVAAALMAPALAVAALAEAQGWSGLVTLAMICLYAFCFFFAWGTIPWIYPAEIFAMAERDKAVALAVFWQYAMNGLVVVATPFLIDWSVAGTFGVFGALNLLNVLFVVLSVRETRCVPLEKVPALFGVQEARASLPGA